MDNSFLLQCNSFITFFRDCLASKQNLTIKNMCIDKLDDIVNKYNNPLEKIRNFL